MFYDQPAKTKFLVDPSGVLTQVSALVYRLKAGQLELLLITSRGTKRWILPKGWPIKGATMAAAAKQEAYEEMGILGEIAAEPCGYYADIKRAYRAKKLKITPCPRPNAAPWHPVIQAFAEHGTQREFDLPVHNYVFPLVFASQAATWPEYGEREHLWVAPTIAAEHVREPGLQALLRNFTPPPGLAAKS